MKRPNIKDYQTSNQMEYREQLNKYYDELEKYINHLEEQNEITLKSDEKIHYDALLDCCNHLLDDVDLGMTPIRPVMGLRLLLSRDKTKDK